MEAMLSHGSHGSHGFTAGPCRAAMTSGSESGKPSWPGVATWRGDVAWRWLGGTGGTGVANGGKLTE